MARLLCVGSGHEWIYTDFTELIYSGSVNENTILYRTCNVCGRMEMLPNQNKPRWIKKENTFSQAVEVLQKK